VLYQNEILHSQGGKVKLLCPFSKVYEPFLDLPISDGAFRTLLFILRRDFEDRYGYRKGYVYITNTSLAKERGLDLRTVRNHISELRDMGLIKRDDKDQIKIWIKYERIVGEENVISKKMSDNGQGRKELSWEEEDFVRGGRKNFSSPTKEDELIKEEENNNVNVVVVNNFKGKADSNADPAIPSVKHPDLKRISPLAYQRLVRHFSKELVDRAIRQADLQYKGKKIKKPIGLIYAMLKYGLDDSLLCEQEQKLAKKERENKRKEIYQFAFKYLCYHPEVWMPRYPATAKAYEELKAKYDGDLPEVIAREYEYPIREFIIPDLLDGTLGIKLDVDELGMS